MKSRPELDALIREAIAAFAALSPEDQAAHRQAQAESWARGNLGIDRGPDARRTVSAADPCRKVLERCVEVLREAEQQIEYMHSRWRVTGSGNAVLARIRDAISKAEGGVL